MIFSFCFFNGQKMNCGYLKRREGGPKGRPSEASLKLFLSCGLILIELVNKKTDKKRKLIGGNNATYAAFLPSKLILVRMWSTKDGQKTETNWWQ